MRRQNTEAQWMKGIRNRFKNFVIRVLALVIELFGVVFHRKGYYLGKKRPLSEG